MGYQGVVMMYRYVADFDDMKETLSTDKGHVYSIMKTELKVMAKRVLEGHEINTNDK